MGRWPLQLLLKLAKNLGELFLLAPHGTGRPVLSAQVVQHGAADSKLRVRLKLDTAIGNEFVEGVNQTEDTRVNEILDLDRRWQAGGETFSDILYEGRVLFDEFVSRLLGIAGGNGRFSLHEAKQGFTERNRAHPSIERWECQYDVGRENEGEAGFYADLKRGCVVLPVSVQQVQGPEVSFKRLGG